MMAGEENEIIIYDDPLQAYRIWRKGRRKYSDAGRGWHYHHALEVVFPLVGNLCVNLTKNESLQLCPGAVAIIGPYDPHYLSQTEDEIQYLVFQVDVFKYLGHELMNLKYFTEAGRLLTKINYVLREFPEVNNQICCYMEEIYTEYNQKQKGYEIAIHSLIHRTILALLRNDYKAVLNMDYSAEFQRLLPVLDHIESHICEKIAMENVCELVNMSYFHFSKYFKKVMGKSFREYVNYKKMILAERLLLTSDLTIVEIASSMEMSNLANFYKIFADRFHCTPSEFRKKSRAAVERKNTLTD